MLREVSEPLDHIDRALARLRRDELRERLRRGLPSSEIRQRLEAEGLESSGELELLFGWYDGTDTSQAVLDDIHLFPGFYLLSLEDALANYRAFVEDSRWQAGWLPLFANGGGDFYVFDGAGSPIGEIRHFRIDEQEHPVEFSSISTFFATLSECFESGVFFVDPDGYLEMDDLRFGAVAGGLDPAVAWWRE